MDDVSLPDWVTQADSTDCSKSFHSFMRMAAQNAFMNVMVQEVASLCGPAYHPATNSKHQRAGSAPGYYLFGTEEFSIRKPRVRKDGEEVRLKSYVAAQNRDELRNAMLRAFMANVSTRDQKPLFKEVSGTSRSEVSRLWKNEGLKFIEQLRSRDLSESSYLVLMLDGIGLGDDLCAIVALGITEQGEKHILDFQIGASENREACSDLLHRIEERGFCPRHRLLAVTDGSKALRSSLRKKWPAVIIQRCLIHKERNIKGYISRRHYGELHRLFTRLRKAQGIKAAEECLADLRRFLRNKNEEALNSLEEAGDELLAVHSLEVPSTLNRTLLNTNCIENPFRNVRAKIGRVKRWRPETDMAGKWLAYALLTAEKGFRRIAHYEDLKQLAERLKDLSTPPPEEGLEKASPSMVDSKPQREYNP